MQTNCLTLCLVLLAALTQGKPVMAGECAPIDSVEKFTSSKAAPVGATCSTFLSQSANRGVSCHWEFGFRDQDATAKARSLWGLVQECRAGSDSGPDQLVNHPDSYDLRNWVSGKNVYRVSKKDKGNLQRTLVFLRFEVLK